MKIAIALKELKANAALFLVFGAWFLVEES